MALAGGSTPATLYRQLAADLPWQQTEIWFGDERWVAADHADSNARMARETLTGRLGLDDARVHAMNTGLADADACARDYSDRLRRHAPLNDNGMPLLDLVLLGLGEDGHTASLFPGTSILDVTDRPAAAVMVERLHSWRVSLTLPALSAAHKLLFMVAGAGKAAAVASILSGDTVLPAARACVAHNSQWLLDAAAAGELECGHG